MEPTPPDLVCQRFAAGSKEEDKVTLRELAQQAAKQHMTFARFTYDGNGYIWLEAWKIQPAFPTQFNPYTFAGRA